MFKKVKLVFILVLSIILISSFSFGVTTHKRSFTTYAEKLSSELYPQIRIDLEPYHKNLTKKEANEALEKVIVDVMIFLHKYKLPLAQRPIITIYKFNGEKSEALFLTIRLSFIDEKESCANLHITTTVTKNFLLYFNNINQPTGA